MNMNPSFVLSCLLVWASVCAGQEAAPAPSPASDATPTAAGQPAGEAEAAAKPQQTFSGRFTTASLKALVADQSDLLPLPLQLEGERQAALSALDRVDMSAVIGEMADFLTEKFADRFDLTRHVLSAAVPPGQQVEVDLSDVGLTPYRGPAQQIIGFVVHGMTREEYLNTALRALETARQLVESGEPVFDRTDPNHFKLVAEAEAAKLRAAREKEMADEKEREEIRKRIGQALGVYNSKTGKFDGQASWMRESRRFSYVVDEKTGEFIARLKPLVDQMNRAMEIAGFSPPPAFNSPGIHFDADLGDVEIVLPKPMMQKFLETTDSLEQRMAEKLIVSIEAVRLTDRDIIDGAVAARINAEVQGVHDVNRFNTRGVIRQLGLNSLLAVANQQLQVQTLRGVEAGQFPAGVTPITIASPELPPLQVERTATTIGSGFSIGADPIFFDGREQSYGFSYIGPDGHAHTLGLEVVDSLREFWSRIERNLIVHKIKKVPTLTKFTVPVGPDTATYEGIAALISQEDQELVVATGTGAISQISATAGTWLIIQDFRISPTPGSSTAMTEEELQAIQDKVLLTMWLRDPRTAVELKEEMLESQTREELHEFVQHRLAEKLKDPIQQRRAARSYGEVFEERYSNALEDATAEKKERNSVISLTFYSSQGNIVQTPGSTQLGSANDLTSFTTELRPNTVTPISSFLTKTLEGARGSSPLTGVRKGESSNESKTMTHLLIRARFPTSERENKDLDEGRQLGYFELPINREPLSVVNLPFLSSSEHPLERLASFRVGVMFDALQKDKIRKRTALFDPNVLEGTVPPKVWESVTTRFLLNRKIINDSPGNDATLGPRFRQRFVVQVRSLLEYDSDFFDAPNTALRNMLQWNDPDRIVLALNSSPGRFALRRLIQMIDELGMILVPDEYADQFLARSPFKLLGGHRLHPLNDEELNIVRRDAASHFLRFDEAYGDSFLEAVSMILGLGTYRAMDHDQLMAGPLRSYHDLVVFDRSGGALAEEAGFKRAHDKFMLLKQGGYKGKLFEPSCEALEHLDTADRDYVIRGRNVLEPLQ